jgi:hypothetical protein
MPAEAGNSFGFSSLGLPLLHDHGLTAEVCLDDCVPRSSTRPRPSRFPNQGDVDVCVGVYREAPGRANG